MNKSALILLSSLLFSWSTAVFPTSKKHLLGTSTENGAKIAYYLEIKPKTGGQTELINQSASMFLFEAGTTYRYCDIFLHPDRNISFSNIADYCRGKKVWHIKYQGKERTLSKTKKTEKDPYRPNKNFSHRLKFGFENDAKYIIITNKRESVLSNHSMIHSDL